MNRRPTLLLLHGALGAASQFDSLVPLLEENFELHVPDLPGHGGTPLSGEAFSIAGFAEYLRDWLDQHQITGADIFGYSMGGYVALHLARHSPAHVGRIFTLATKFAWDPAASARETKMLDPRVIQEKVPRFAEQLKARHTPENWEGVLGKTAEMMTNLGERNELAIEELSHVGAPVTIAVGDRDQMVGIEESLAAYRQLPNGRFLVVPGTPHPLEKVSQGRLAREIGDFFLGEGAFATQHKSTKSIN